MQKNDKKSILLTPSSLPSMGLDASEVASSVDYAHTALGCIDSVLWTRSALTLSKTVEMNTMSAVLGNIFRQGIIRASGGKFTVNTPGQHPDLIALKLGCKHIEIKTCLGDNAPKLRCSQPGFFLVVRYSLQPSPKHGRAGVLGPGQNGVRGASINKLGLNALEPVYLDLNACPYKRGTKLYGEIESTIRGSEA